MRNHFKIFLLSLFLLSSDFSPDITYFGKRNANAGIFPDNKIFSIPLSQMKRYRKAGRKRLTTKNLRNSTKYIEIVKDIKKILSFKKDSEYAVLLSHWQIGEKIANVTSDRESSRNFNDKLFTLLSIDCKINLSELYDSVRLYRILFKLKDREKRERILKECVKKGYKPYDNVKKK